nr:uncharacterized protein LOC113715932 [Coffea arabica]
MLDDERLSLSSTDNNNMDFSDFEEHEDAAIVRDSETDDETDPLKKDYAIEKGFPLVRVKNERTRCTAKCGSEGCNWRIHASPVANTTIFMVKTYNPEHTCVMSRKNTEATSDWMAKKLIAVLREHPEMSTKGIIAEMKKFGVEPNRMRVYRARDKALDEIEGSHALSYAKLPKYAILVRAIQSCFKAQKDGFLTSCRPFVGFDGCHLKGSFGGMLLTAVALDGNNSLFPLAFAIVECENKETWSWQKGLNLAYEEIVPAAVGRYCCWHIYNNFKLKFPGLMLRRYFWQAAKSFDSVGHNEAMDSIKT